MPLHLDGHTPLDSIVRTRDTASSVELLLGKADKLDALVLEGGGRAAPCVVRGGASSRSSGASRRSSGASRRSELVGAQPAALALLDAAEGVECAPGAPVGLSARAIELHRRQR